MTASERKERDSRFRLCYGQLADRSFRGGLFMPILKLSEKCSKMEITIEIKRYLIKYTDI